jgi:hypothetical protein
MSWVTCRETRCSAVERNDFDLIGLVCSARSWIEVPTVAIIELAVIATWLSHPKQMDAN